MEAKEEVNAKKDTYGEAEAMSLLKGINEIYAAKGKKVVHLDLKKEKPTQDEVKKVVLGPTGNLRAPALRKGKTLIVGFDHEIYQKFFS